MNLTTQVATTLSNHIIYRQLIQLLILVKDEKFVIQIRRCWNIATWTKNLTWLYSTKGIRSRGQTPILQPTISIFDTTANNAYVTWKLTKPELKKVSDTYDLNVDDNVKQLRGRATLANIPTP